MIDTSARTDEDFARLGTDIQRRIGVKTSRHEPLARFTTMRVGGPADLFAEIHNLFELRAIVRFARSRELPLFILGRGSDLVISDKGIRGLVIHNRAQQVRFEGNRLTADSGLPMAARCHDLPSRRPFRARIRLGHPGDRRRRRLGECRRT